MDDRIPVIKPGYAAGKGPASIQGGSESNAPTGVGERARIGDLEIWIERIEVIGREDYPLLSILFRIRNTSKLPYAVFRKVRVQVSLVNALLANTSMKDHVNRHEFTFDRIAPGEMVEVSWRIPQEHVVDTYQVSLDAVSWVQNLRRIRIPDDGKEPLQVWRLSPPRADHGHPSENPYTLKPLAPTSPLYQPLRLLGEDDKDYSAEELVNRSKQGDLVLLVGEPLGGKTTLLWHFAHLLQQQGKKVHVLAGSGELPRYWSGPTLSLSDIEKKAPAAGDDVFVVLADDFLMTADLAQGSEILRKLLRGSHVAFVATVDVRTAEKLQGDIGDEGIKVETYWIRWFGRDEVLRLVQCSGLLFDASLPDLVYEWSGGHPYFTQLSLHTLYSFWENSGFMRSDGSDSVMWQILDVYHNAIRAVWSRFSYEEQMVLYAVAYWYRIHGGPVSISDVVTEVNRWVNPSSRVIRQLFPDIVAAGEMWGARSVSKRVDEGAQKLKRLYQFAQKVYRMEQQEGVSRHLPGHLAELFVRFCAMLGEEDGFLERLGQAVSSAEFVAKGLARASRSIDDMPSLRRRRELTAWADVFYKNVGRPLLALVEWEKEDGSFVRLMPHLGTLIRELRSFYSTTRSLPPVEKDMLESLLHNLTSMQDMLYKLGYEKAIPVTETLGNLERRQWLLFNADGNVLIRPYLLYLWLNLWEPSWARCLVEPEAT